MPTNQRFGAWNRGWESPKASGQQLVDDRRRDDTGPQRDTAAGDVLDPDDPHALSPGEVREQLQRILDSPNFEASERRKRFLCYVVEEMLAGRGDRLKGYAIATAVFDRDDGFDPQTDPVVRLEARRLRRALEHYYLTAGRDDPIRIEIPKGGYVPICERQESASTGSSPGRQPAHATRSKRPRSRLVGRDLAGTGLQHLASPAS